MNHLLALLRLLYMNVANSIGSNSSAEKRWFASLVLGSVSGFFVLNVLGIASAPGSPFFGLAGGGGGGRSGGGAIMFLLLGVPAILAWHRIGRSATVFSGSAVPWARFVFFVLFVLNTFGVVWIAIEVSAVLALIAQAVQFVVLVTLLRRFPVKPVKRD